MKMRSDSVFAKLTEEQRDALVDVAETMTLDDLVEMLKKGPEPIRCSPAALSRFLRKAKADKLLRDAEGSDESVEAFAKRADGGKVRDAALAVMRDRMFDVAVDTNNREQFMEMFAALNAEREKEKARELEERKVRIAEENAKLGWRKLECENARSGVKLLPKVREVLIDAARTPEERVAMALEVLGVEGGKLLLKGSDED